MHNGICSVCGATTVYRGTQGIAATGAHQLHLIGHSNKFLSLHTNLDVTPFVCRTCGHVTLQVAPEDLETLTTLLQAKNWTHVPPPKQQD